MNPTYHIFYRYQGQRGSELQSITPARADENGNIIGFATGGFCRNLWDRMVNTAHKTGGMVHPDTGNPIEFASLQYGGHVDKQGAGQGGMLCQKWSKDTGLVKVFEPEPDFYGPKVVDDTPESVPDQPEPPGVTGLDAYAPQADPLVAELEAISADPEPEVAATKRKKRATEPKVEV